MHLYLLRHGIAEDKGSRQSDAERALTKKGKEELKRVMRVAAQAGVKPSVILTSPYVRARQTAEIAKDGLDVKEPLLETRTLTPDGAPHLVWAELSDHRKEPSLMLVSHNPLVEQLVALLLGTPTLRFDFATGAIAAIEINNFRGEPDGTLQWVLTPDLSKTA